MRFLSNYNRWVACPKKLKYFRLNSFIQMLLVIHCMQYTRDQNTVLMGINSSFSSSNSLLWIMSSRQRSILVFKCYQSYNKRKMPLSLSLSPHTTTSTHSYDIGSQLCHILLSVSLCAVLTFQNFNAPFSRSEAFVGITRRLSRFFIFAKSSVGIVLKIISNKIDCENSKR